MRLSAQAFQSLVRSLLSESDAELSRWREALREALEPNGRLIADLVPELTLMMGEQPQIPVLEPQQAKGRLQLAFRRFIGVFARPEHPLALFLDDLQWLDLATLDFIEDILTRSDLRHLLLIGAYRDNEVDAHHPLTRKLTAIRGSGAKISEIKLGPLDHEHVTQLIGDALACEKERANPLVQMVHEKTAGNPFFVLQFVYSLADEGLLAFDPEAQRWSWDLDRIDAKGYTDNVIDLMVGKLARLPPETQKALQELSCLGAVTDTAALATALGRQESEVHEALREAVRLEVVERLPGLYRFVHDRLQEAAYSLIPEGRRAEAHLRIGRLLVRRTPTEKREEAVFDIVNQLNRGAALIVSPEEREKLAELNLIAGKRAKASTAYAGALNYFAAGAALLPEGVWERRRDLVFLLELNRAECEFLTGSLTDAEEHLATLSKRAANVVERATVTCLRIDLYTTLGQLDRAIGIGLEYLHEVGIECSPRPTDEDVRHEYRRISSRLDSRAIEQLIDLPLMTDPVSLATLDVLIGIVPPAALTSVNLAYLVMCEAAKLSLERGNSDGSCFAFEWLGVVASARFGDYRAGFRFCRLGYELVEQRGLRRLQARIYLNFGTLMGWTRPILECRDLLRRTFDAANKTGDFPYAAYACFAIVTNFIMAGDRLVQAQHEAEHGLAFAQKMGFGLVIDITATQLAFVKTLRGATHKFGSFDDDRFEEQQIERRLSGNPNLARANFWYWIRKLQALFFACEHTAAVDASLKASRLLSTSPLNLELAEYHFYAALSRAACCGFGSRGEREQHLAALAAHHVQLQEWAANCPENFENRAALVGAEIARLEGREIDAERLYEQAIRSARHNAFVHNEAVACELAALFYQARGFEDIALMYLRKARYCYRRWGADAKVRQLDERHANLREEEPALGSASTIGAPVESLDIATIIRVSQAVSGEMVLEKLLDTLMRIAIAQAGAERGLLILSDAGEPRIAAEATTSGGTVSVKLGDAPVTASSLPRTVLHHVLRAQETVLLDDAVAELSFASDPYIRERRARSILCLPLINQGKLNGVLYLENNLAPRVFAPALTAVLRLLASQAATSPRE